jgi:cohesin loading factor subunit SCC2
MDSKKNITVSKKISGDQDADATLFGGILTTHASRLLQMTQVKDKRLRFAALDLVGHLLRQGQINPNETVPYLLALQGDVEEDGIRSYALKLLMIEGEKRPDMLRQRVYAGIKQAYAFQKHVYPSKAHVSALVKVGNGSSTQFECVFGRVYKECIASIRKQRRGLFSSLLHRFDLQSRKKAVESAGKNANQSTDEKFIGDLPLLSFTAQVLAYLPYKVASDPLFVIYNINSALALRGPELLDRLATFLRPYGLSSSDEMDESNCEEDALELAAKKSSPRRTKNVRRVLDPDFDIKTFSSLCAEAAAQTLLLRLKAFLREAYEFNEARIVGFNPDAREVAEKALSRAPNLMFNSVLTMESVQGEVGTRELDTLIVQYAEFRKLIREQTSLDANFLEEDDDDADDETRTTPRKRHRSIAGATADADDEVMSP